MQITRTKVFDYSICIFKKDGSLIHMPIEFPKTWQKTSCQLLLLLPRKREVGFVVPARFKAVAKELRAATVLSKEVFERRNEHSYLELSFDDSKFANQPFLK